MNIGRKCQNLNKEQNFIEKKFRYFYKRSDIDSLALILPSQLPVYGFHGSL